MVASIGKIASPAQGVSYFERDGYYAKDDPAHREASAWAGKGAEALGLSGAIDAQAFQAVLEGKVPDGPHVGKRDRNGNVHHRPGRDATLSAPKSVSLARLPQLGGHEGFNPLIFRDRTPKGRHYRAPKGEAFRAPSGGDPRRGLFRQGQAKLVQQ